jgi:hypothetical protein
MNKIKGYFKNIDFWKLVIMVILLILILAWFNFTIDTKWGSIYRNDTEKFVNSNLTKIKTQINYSNDMKERIMADISDLYEEKLKIYCKENDINVTPEQILNDVKYYKLIIIAMNDYCNEMTLFRFIIDNELYRYSNKADWDKFIENAANIFLKKGRQIVYNYYDNTKVIMPVQCWEQMAGRELQECLIKNTTKLLEDLKTESILYYNLKTKHK